MLNFYPDQDNQFDGAGDGKGDGVEDEQAPVEQNQHAERDPADEQAEASQHTEVLVTNILIGLLRLTHPGYRYVPHR